MNNAPIWLSNALSHLQALLSEHLVAITFGVALLIVLIVVLAGRFGAAAGDAGTAETSPPAAEPAAAAPARPAAVAAVAPPAPASPPAPAMASEPPAILVVDDSAVARAKLRKLFEAGGYRVEVARDGVEALEALSAGFYSVLITDLEMPNMNGLELIAHVQGSLETENLPIIAITGHDELQARVHDYESLYGIFKKPWHDRDLLRRVEALATLRTRPGMALRTEH